VRTYQIIDQKKSTIPLADALMSGFAMLMMLAFLVDQTQQLTCPLFRAAWEKLRNKKVFGRK